MTAPRRPAGPRPTVPPMRVVLLLKTSRGGLWTLPHVDELRRRGHDVVAVLPAEAGALRTELGARGVRVEDSAFDFRFRARPATLRGLLALRRQLRALRPDVLHYHLYASALAGRLASLGAGVRRVHMVAGPLYLESGVIRSVERVLMRLDHVVIGGSEHTAARYRGMGLPGHRVLAVPYGVDTARFAPPDERARAAARARLGVGPAAFVVVMVAYVYAPKRAVHQGRGIKGHDVLLAAWRSFSATHPDARLLLVGAGFDGPGEDHRQALLRRFEVDADPSVTWLSSVEDVRTSYAAADLSVSPSLSENHGAALEASAMGVPCVVSDAGALPETVDGRSGWVVPRGDVDALAAALTAAAGEFGRGDLAARGRRARTRTVERFERRDAARAVADAVERAGRAGDAVPLHPVYSRGA